MRVNATALNVRACPRTDCRQKRQVYDGALVTVYEIRGAWARISSAEDWVYRKYLSKSEYRTYKQAELACDMIELTSEESCDELD